jgi:pantoate--beta-alanine ligase
VRSVFDPTALQAQMLALRASGKRIGFVPTMGLLHRGHTSLMKVARPLCDHLVVSIYVNPLQFGPGEDLDRYPRDPDGDAQKCRDAGVDTLFLPPDLYHPDHATHVNVSGLTGCLCGAHRPGHFEGVTTVVARLFGIIQPSLAVFGEKDFQQLAVIRRMTRDLAMPVEVLGAPLVRDEDGVALSSRNAFLTAEQRVRARTLHQALYAMRSANFKGETDRTRLLDLGRSCLDADAIDYLEILHPHTLEPLNPVTGPSRAFGAAHYGRTRLIDNISLSDDS